MVFSNGCTGVIPGREDLLSKITDSCALGVDPNFVALGFDAVNLIYRAIDHEQRRDKNISRESLVRFFRRAAPVKGVASNYIFNEKGENEGADFHTYRIVDRRWKHCECDSIIHSNEIPNIDLRVKAEPESYSRKCIVPDTETQTP